jgi:hypothetical protein
MEAGRTPEEAALATLARMATRTREGRLLADPGRPNFNVTIYAIRKDGMTGCASMHEGYEYVLQRGAQTSTERAAFLFPKS